MYGADAMGITAENLAKLYSINRKDQDLFAGNSQTKASIAQQNGLLAKEIVSVEIPQRKGNPITFSQDEFIRPSTTIEMLSSLKPVFKNNGTVTAGTSKVVNKCTLPITEHHCVDILITELAVFKFIDGQLTLIEILPGSSIGEIRAKTPTKTRILHF